MMKLALVAALLCASSAVSAQTPPPLDKLPPTNVVRDRSRPDYGYRRPWLGAEVTVTVVFPADCSSCAESVGFYKKVAGLSGMDGTRGALVVLAQDGIWPVIDVFHKVSPGFRPTTVSYPEDDRFRTKVFPSLYVFDGAGKRIGAWEGKLTAGQEGEVIALVKHHLSGGAR